MADFSQSITDYYTKISRERQNARTFRKILRSNISRISPSSCFSLAASNIAGTSIELNRDYLEQAYNYQNTLKKIIEEKSKSANLLQTLAGAPGTISVKDIPQFVYSAPAFSKYIPRVILDLSY